MRSIATGDVDGVLSDYGSDTVIIFNHHVFSGEEQLRSCVQQIMAINAKGKSTPLKLTINENIIDITWTYQLNNDTKIYYQTDTYVIIGGKIRAQLFFSRFYEDYPIAGPSNETINSDSGSLTLARTAEEVWKHRLQAFKTHDLDEILSDYTDESFLIVNKNLYKGKDQIRTAHEELFTLYATGKYTLLNTTILDDIIYITKSFQPYNGTETYYGTDSFVISNGMIQAQTITNFFEGSFQ